MTEKIILDVEGMKCAGCLQAVEKQLTQYPGVKSVCVNLATEIALLEVDLAVVNPEFMAKTLTSIGFPTQVRKTNHKIDGAAAHLKILQQRQEARAATRQLIIAGLLLVLSSFGHLGIGNTVPILHNLWFHFALATLAIIIPGRQIIVDGWLGWRRGAPNMHTLIGLGTLIAYFASVVALLFPQIGWECFFDEPVMMLGFILLGRVLEQKARSRAAAAFKQLLALQPQTARLMTQPDPEKLVVGENILEIPVDRVLVGEWLQVLPGDQIPVDGKVCWGQTTVDESMLTGEAVPVVRQTGDRVIGGTLNQSGTIAIVATQTGDDTTLSQIVALVEAAQTRKAPVQKIADTVAGYFTYGVLTASLLTFLFWYFFGTDIWSGVLAPIPPMAHMMGGDMIPEHIPINLQNTKILVSLKLAIAVMVVACPCALGLATPTAILVGTGIGAERGLLIKGGDVLEKVHQLDTVVFDKTGTLTTGNPKITDCLVITAENGENLPLNLPVIDSQSLLQLAAAVESGTHHPLAKAISQAASEQELSIPHATDFHTEPGLGVSGVVAGNKVFLGNWDWLNQQGIAIGDLAQQLAQQLATQGKTVIGVAVAQTLVGLIAVSDTLRPDAKTTVENLRRMGLRVMLLSGDRLEAVHAIAQQLGMDSDDVMAGILPAQKAKAIQSLQGRDSNTEQKFAVVAMVGDGINDAPALSQADVGISLHSGTDVARSSAEIILMRDSLSDVVESILLSRATFNKIRQNLFFAIVYNTIGIPLAAGVLLPSLGFALGPSTAAGLMAFSSISVVTNSVLLRRFIH
jgi:Cu2+-exporting ATPase